MKRSSGWNQEVTDKQGRRRFHGAFTGGFSAGHFNTVGSEEGWTPSTFVSSRTNRANVALRRAEDFMDEEDDPLLGKQLETSEAFDTLHTNEKARRLEAATKIETKPHLFQVPDELILPTTGDSVGKKLLSRMGWKEGHGIGPRLRRRKLSIGEDDEETKSEENEKHADSEEVYVPPRNVVSARIFPKPKTDKYGAGFDPYVNAPEFLQHKLRQEENDPQQKPQRQIVTFAQALGSSNACAAPSNSCVTMGFGLSALEENDDLDVYGTTSMDDFDRAIAPASESTKLLDSMTSSARDKQRRERHESSAMLCSDGRPALKGFRIATKKQKPPKNVIDRLVVPEDFRAYHVFTDKEGSGDVASFYGKYNFSTEKSGRGSMMTARQRAQMLEEGNPLTDQTTAQESMKPSAGSVFDLLDPAQREKLQGAAQAARERKPLTQSAPTEQFRANIMASISKRFVSASTTENASTVDNGEASSITQPVEKKSYRDEDAWAPHVLLCKRFRVKCEGQTISGGAQGDDHAQDLFTTELAPHLMDLASSRRSTKSVNAAIPARPTHQRSEDDELPPLPSVPKPSTDLLRSIFEPSDESDVEEEEGDDSESGSDTGGKSTNETEVVVPSSSDLSLNPFETITDSREGKSMRAFSDDDNSSEDTSNSDRDKDKPKHKHKKSKKTHRNDDRKSHKHKKSSSKSEKKVKKKKKTSERSRRRERSRSRDRSRSREVTSSRIRRD